MLRWEEAYLPSSNRSFRPTLTWNDVALTTPAFHELADHNTARGSNGRERNVLQAQK